MVKLQIPAEIENDLSKQLQDAVRLKIKEQKWDEKVLAEKLDLLPVGVKNLLARKEWTISTALRVASALNTKLVYRIENS